MARLWPLCVHVLRCVSISLSRSVQLFDTWRCRLLCYVFVYQPDALSGTALALMLAMKYIVTIILSLSIRPLVAAAQQQWTLDRCVGYALEHSTEVRKQAVEQRQAQVDYRTALLDFLPGVSAGVSGQYSWGRNIDPETNTYNNVTTFNNNYSITASMVLFDGGRTWNALRRARLARRLAPTNMQKAKDDKAIDVMQKYVDAVYAARVVELMEEKLRDSEALLAKTRVLHELGEKSRPEVVQVESQVAEDGYNLLHQQNAARTAMLALKSAMDYPAADSLTLCSELPAATPLPAAGCAVTDACIASKPAVVIAEGNAERARINWKMQRGALLPRLSLSGGVSTNYYENVTSGQAVAAFRSQLRNNLGEYLYLSLSVPIFSPGDWQSARRAVADYYIARLDAEDARRQLRDEAEQAVADYRGYLKEAESLRRRVASDSLAYRLSRRKYEEGMLSALDLHETAQAYTESRITLLQTRLLLAIRLKLVRYYINNEPLWTSN